MPEHLIDMRLTKKERDNDDATVSEDREYPYGLTINLDSESMQKLGMEKLPAVGSKLSITAMASVTRVSVEDDGDGKEQSMTLQIESLSLDAGERPTNAQVFFDDKS